MKTVIQHSLLTDFDIYLFKSGTHYRLYEKLGSHPMEIDGEQGCYFAVWAPNAHKVFVTGDFNSWNAQSHLLHARPDGSGIWEGFIAGAKIGHRYKYSIWASFSGEVLLKGDPFARLWENPPQTASVITSDQYAWEDKNWMETRKDKNSLASPYSVYEVHLGSWKRKAEDNFRSLSYRELADELVPYVKELGFTHVELMPVMEHPYFASWGYQITGYFATSARYGKPEDFKYLVDRFHQEGIGVILDWVPSHFPTDAHGLARFDGTYLYEHADPRKGYHPDWKSSIFNYDRNEVRSFLISNAVFWLDQFHADGLRVDAVASMLYLDYSRNEGEWIPNIYGGRENLGAVSLFKDMNAEVYKSFPDVQTIAEESTAWPGVSKPVYAGGLGFGMKWMMGWMHDTLKYFAQNPIWRRWHHNQITFSMIYAFSENFMLPFSHDEVVHGKGPLIDKMPGDQWQKYANLRAMFTYMFTHPGSKLMFMGSEIGQTTEWNHDGSLRWDLLDKDPNTGIKALVKSLNSLLKSEPALYDYLFDPKGFDWVDADDAQNSVLSYVRKGKTENDMILVVLNLTPKPHPVYRIGSTDEGVYNLLFNSDDKNFWGSGYEIPTKVETESEPWHRRDFSANFVLAPLSAMIYKFLPKPAKKARKATAKKEVAPKAPGSKAAKKPVITKADIAKSDVVDEVFVQIPIIEDPSIKPKKPKAPAKAVQKSEIQPEKLSDVQAKVEKVTRKSKMAAEVKTENPAPKATGARKASPAPKAETENVADQNITRKKK